VGRGTSVWLGRVCGLRWGLVEVYVSGKKEGERRERNTPIIWTPVFKPVAFYVYALPSFPYHVCKSRRSKKTQQREEGNIPSFCAACPVHQENHKCVAARDGVANCGRNDGCGATLP